MSIGQVVPTGKVKSIQHLEGGIIRKILVREGDRVKRGQRLVVLEPTQSTADVKELQIRLTSLRVKIASLQAAISGSDKPAFDEEIRMADPKLVEQAQAAFRAKKDRISSQILSQKKQIVQREQEIKEIQARLRNNAKSLKFIREQVAISNKQLKLGLSNRMEHLNLLQSESSLTGRLEEDRAALPRSRAARDEADAKLRATELGFQEEARNDLEESTRTHKELSQRIQKFQDNLKRTVLTAPVDGIIKSLFSATEGGVLRPGGTMLDIVPADDLLIIEARLQPQDIGYVRPGMSALVQLMSSDAPRFGNLSGEVILVSPDTLVSKAGVPYYKVLIRTERAYFKRNKHRYDLFPGLQVQSSIQTGTRTVLEYILDPYLGSFGNALRER